MAKDIDILEVELRRREAGIEFLKDLEAKLRKESGEYTEKIKPYVEKNITIFDGEQQKYFDLLKRRFIIDDAISKAYGLIQFLTKK